jgi:chaperone-like protein
MVGLFVGKAAGLVGCGLAGAVAYDGVKRLVRSEALRSGAVSVTSWGLRGARAVETGAERARLVTADIVSEAREKIGEQTPPPGVGAPAHNHEH